MKFSIVTISFNQAEFLERTILSVINQNYPDLEYIIVDPGSTDGSREIIQKYAHFFSHVIFEPDQGAADGLNKGFARATGDIFGFLNSDDVLLEGTLQKVSTFLNHHPNVDVVSGHAVIIDEHDQRIRNSYSDPFSLVGYAYGSVVLMQPSTFFKAQVFKSVSGFNVNNKSNWDGELFVDLSLNGAQFYLINELLSGYRLHSQSITSSKKLDDLIKLHHQNMFYKIVGREMRKSDLILKAYLTFYKYIKSPKSFYERISRGAIYGRLSSSNV